MKFVELVIKAIWIVTTLLLALPFFLIGNVVAAAWYGSQWGYFKGREIILAVSSKN